MSKAPKKSIQAIIQKENPEFAEAVASLSVEELNGRLAQLAKDGEQVQESKEADEELAELQAKVSLASAGYRDAKKAIRLKSRYLIALIREKGGA